MATTEQDQWVADALGVTVEQYAGLPAKPAPRADAVPEPPLAAADMNFEAALYELNQSIEPNMSEAPAWNAMESLPAGAPKAAAEFKQTFGKKFASELPLLGGCLTAKFSASVAVSGAIETVGEAADEAEGEITASATFDDAKVALRVAEAWHDENGVKVFGWHGVFTEVRTSGGVELGDGVSIEFGANGTLACGTELSFKLVLVKVGEHEETKVLECSVGVELGLIDFPSFSMALGPYHVLKELKVAPVVGVDIEPDWAKITERYLLEFATDAAIGVGTRTGAQAGLEVAAEQGATGLGTAAGVDLAIAAAPLVIALSVVPGALIAISNNREMGETGDKCRAATKEFLDGYLIGILGGGEPDGDFGMAGYKRGQVALDAAAARMVVEHPGTTLDEVKDAIAEQADRIMGEVEPEFVKQVQTAFWDNYRDTHQGVGHAQRRSIVYGAIFGHGPPGPV